MTTHEKWIPAALAAVGVALLTRKAGGASGRAAPAFVPPEVCPTVYGGDTGLAVQLDRTFSWLVPGQPDGVMLHTTQEDIRANASRWVQRVHAAIPNAQVWFGTTGDEHWTEAADGRITPAQLLSLRLAAGQSAKAAGARVLMHNCEQAWKRNLPGFRAGDATEMIHAIRESTGGALSQWMTSYYAPTYHAEFPWYGFHDVDGYSPQIYFEDGGGADALALFRRSWARAIALGWINPNAFLASYLRLREGKGRLSEQSYVSDQFGTLNGWWCNDGCDTVVGRPLILALCKLRLLGFRGQGRIAAFQRANGLTVDGKIGPQTLAALDAAR